MYNARAEFQTIASETVRGLMGKFADASNRPAARYGNQRTFFGETKEGRKSQKKLFAWNAESSTEYETVKNSFEEALQRDGTVLKDCNCATDV